MSMRFVISIENIDSGEAEEVIAGLPVLRKWETDHGKPAITHIQEGYVGPLLELATMAHNRKHGRTLSVEIGRASCRERV